MSPKTPTNPPRGARAGILLDRLAGATQVHVFTPARSLLEAHIGEARAWIRVLGYGLSIKDTRRHPPIFSERQRPRSQRQVGPFLVKVLKPGTPAPGIDPETARRMKLLAARHAAEVASYHGKAFADVTLDEITEWVAATERGSELAAADAPAPPAP